MMAKVESFELDHNNVKAPYIRLAGQEDHQGAHIEKYDIRLLQPNQGALPTAALHTLEHFFAIHIRDYVEGVIDISPMGCRTGFYLVVWDQHTTEEIGRAVVEVLKQVLQAEGVAATTAKACGNYRDHSLFGAQAYASDILSQGFSIDPFERVKVIKG